MRDDNTKPGDLSAQLTFGRVYGTAPDRGQVKPSIEIMDASSGRILTINLTAEDLAEMLAGGSAKIPADRVNGFKGVRDWGKVHTHVVRTVKMESGDWKLRDMAENAARKLPHVAAVIAELEADGYQCAAPRRDNSSNWLIIGRRYDEPA